MAIKLVIFDADDTLIDFHKCERFALEYVFKELNLVLNQEIYDLFSKIDRDLWSYGKWENQSVEKLDIPILRFNYLFKHFNINYTNYSYVNELFMKGLKSAVFPLNDSFEVLKERNNKNIKTSVATNGLIELQKPRIENTNFGRYINQIVTSEEVGESKPNPKIFIKILEDNNIDNSEVIVCGDSLSNDILGAKNANIKSVWFNPNMKKNNTSIIPDYSINSLKEIILIIDSLKK